MRKLASFCFFALFCIGVNGGFNFGDAYVRDVERSVQSVVEQYDQNLLVLNNAACISQLKLFLKNLFKPDGDFWALKMIDASFKIPAGILEFNTAWVGSFQECLDISSSSTNVSGKYCLTTIAVSDETDLTENLGGSKSKGTPNQLQESQLSEAYNFLQYGEPEGSLAAPLIPSFGVCVPNACTEEDLYTIASSLVSVAPWSVMCQTKDTLHPEFTTGAIVTISFFCLVGVIMIISSIYDYLIQSKNGKPNSGLAAFSMYTNGKKLFKVSKNSGGFSCLNGIRVLSMMWVILYHVFFHFAFGPLSNFLEIVKYMLNGKRSAIVANATFSVDSFLVVTGMLVVYNFLKARHQGHKFNLIEFYRHRYLRITPPIIAVMLVCMYLLNYMASGPYYPEIDGVMGRPCRQNWWAVLLHIQTYAVDLTDYCMTHTWYLNVDWQVYLVAPLFLLFITKYTKLVMSVLVLCIAGTMTFSYLLTWNKKLSTTNIMGDIVNYNKHYYFKTHTRVSPWIIGGILGYFMAQIKLKGNKSYMRLPKWLIGVMWVIVLASLVACVFAGYKTLASLDYHPYSSAFFNAFARPAWATCISWVIFACSVGYGGIINDILSWSGFELLNKFSYSIYLTHFLMVYVILYSREYPRYFSFVNVAYAYWGIFVFSFFISIFWVMAFEMPIVELERYFFGGHKKPKSHKSVPENGTNGKAADSVVITTELTVTENQR